MISVIVPVYKVIPWLDRCIESILSQTYRDFELLLVDDGSPDGCGEMCEAWAKRDGRIRVFHKSNGGLSDARNYGLDHMRGDFVTFVDSDDYVMPDYLSYLLSLFDVCPKVGFVEGGLFFRRNQQMVPRDGSGQIKVMGPREAFSDLMYDQCCYVSAWGKLFRKQMFSSLRFPKGRKYEDSYVYPDYWRQSDVMVYGAKPIYVYDVRNGSITTSGFDYGGLKDHFDSYNQLSSYAVSRFPDLIEAKRRYLAFSRMRTLRQMKNISLEHLALRSKLRQEVLSDAVPLLLNPKVPRRDKVGILSLALGFRFYVWAWDVYMRHRG